MVAMFVAVGMPVSWRQSASIGSGIKRCRTGSLSALLIGYKRR